MISVVLDCLIIIALVVLAVVIEIAIQVRVTLRGFKNCLLAFIE